MDNSPEKTWIEQEKRKVALKLLQDHPNYVLIELRKGKNCTLDCFETKT